MKRAPVALIVVLLAVPASFVIYEGVQTLRILTFVERERDRWQRPADVLGALATGDGATVVDLGAGAGYFALKLSPVVGPRGAVIAEDVRRESLAFLWIRRFFRDARNVRVVLGTPDDPRLPAAVDAVLIANTYHELSPPGPILDAVFGAMKPGARLVILDRTARDTTARSDGAGRHDVPLAIVDDEIRRHGFETLARDGRFIDRFDDDDIWWMIVARKPYRADGGLRR
jgi:predicted methyltransferase